ncbi:class I SAM-dependent methyltransferase [Saccharopolyspora halophila]|uniref:Class I SAM-dependent methyltransferase n=1 Tax=Saccharopolyspora halophila TaxID=405551 RepID=A0ABN3GVH9_9PSEU
MGTTVEPSVFTEAYANGSPPWVIGAPQPAVLELEAAGEIAGAVLDPGCGTGEHTMLLAERGYQVLGVDAAPNAIELAETNASKRGIDARFAVGDAMEPPGGPYDTVVDSALFHVFDADDQRRYADGLHRACGPGARVHVLALADAEPALGPVVPRSAFAAAFADGWRLEGVRETTYRGVARGEHATAFGVGDGDLVDAPAWLATAVRL